MYTVVSKVITEITVPARFRIPMRVPDHPSNPLFIDVPGAGGVVFLFSCLTVLFFSSSSISLLLGFFVFFLLDLPS